MKQKRVWIKELSTGIIWLTTGDSGIADDGVERINAMPIFIPDGDTNKYEYGVVYSIPKFNAFVNVSNDMKKL